MTLRELPRALSPARWAIVGVILVCALVACWYVLTEPGRARQRAAAAGAEGELARAFGRSAVEAGQLVDQARDQAARSETLTQETADAIQAAPGAGQRLDPALNRTARERLCLRAAYRDRPECLQRPGAAQP